VAVCAACPLRPQCIHAKDKRGRWIQPHPQEGLLQQARAFQDSSQFQPYRAMRQTAEHRLARLVQLGIRQARYFGRQKTLFQLLMAATVANLTLIATKTRQMHTQKGQLVSFFAWLDMLERAIREVCVGWEHLVHHFRRLCAVAVSKMPVFG
jgi:hypothetical protein